MPSHAPAAQLPVLVIEDEPTVMAFIRTALEKHGYRVAEAVSGTEGLAMLRSNRYHGIISDMRTPGGVSGADVYAWVMENHPELRPKMFFTTGDTANEETASILKSTGVPYIEKPFRVNQLMELVESILGKPQPAQAAP
ncbi:MAG TPA: response regulator [Terriglobales bacterium]|nr:response regulator [Terriglobales bacterium]